MDILAWITMWISKLVGIIEYCHPKITDIHVDTRGFLEIHAWICYGFLDQGIKKEKCLVERRLSKLNQDILDPPQTFIQQQQKNTNAFYVFPFLNVTLILPKTKNILSSKHDNKKFQAKHICLLLLIRSF